MEFENVLQREEFVMQGCSLQGMFICIYTRIFVDEEIGGTLGMAKFVQRDEFKEMNVACAIDEGKPTLQGRKIFA